jgi:hypothetical protein
MAVAAGIDLQHAHAAIQSAIEAGEPGGLRVLGYGEMTLVVGWPADAPAWALKRLPPFARTARLEAYRELLGEYLAALGERGIAVAPTEFAALPGPRGTSIGYLVQPIAPAGRMLDAFLLEADEPAGRAALAAVAATILGGVDERVALDGQIPNWLLGPDGVPQLVDVSTPMMRDASGRDRLDADLFAAVYPWVVRGVLKRWVAPSVLAGYHDPRTNLTDAAANLLRQNLDRWVPVLLEEAAAAGGEHAPTAAEVRRYHRNDTLLWGTNERLRRTERWWRRRRGEAYPMLLAPPGAIRPKRVNEWR